MYIMHSLTPPLCSSLKLCFHFKNNYNIDIFIIFLDVLIFQRFEKYSSINSSFIISSLRLKGIPEVVTIATSPLMTFLLLLVTVRRTEHILYNIWFLLVLWYNKAFYNLNRSDLFFPTDVQKDCVNLRPLISYFIVTIFDISTDNFKCLIIRSPEYVT